MLGFIDKHGLTFPQVSDDAANVFAHFDVPGQPAWVFVDADGSPDRVLGALEETELDAALERISRGA
jgi:hypothetical protein